MGVGPETRQIQHAHRSEAFHLRHKPEAGLATASQTVLS